MSVTQSFRTFAIEQLGRIAPRIRARSMFGGVGLYAGDFFFALIADDVVYLKADDVTRNEFVSRGLRPFTPYGDVQSVNYYELSADILEDAEALGPWVNQAIGAARRGLEKKSGSSARKTTRSLAPAVVFRPKAKPAPKRAKASGASRPKKKSPRKRSGKT